MAGIANPPNLNQAVEVLTPEVLLETSNKSTRNRNQMIKDYLNVNAYALVLTYVPSYRRKRDDFDIDLPIPRVDRAWRDNLRLFWRPLENIPNLDVIDRQARKHLKFHKLVGRDIIGIGLDHGMEFAAPDGIHNLLNIIERLGYSAGNIYSCAQFVKDLGDQLLFKIKVTFVHHPNGKPSNIRKIHEVHVMCDEDGEEIVEDEKAQSFKPHAVFLFENLRIRNFLRN
ncbi:hypothetical protein AgCh_024365 [Apium graveolens]